MDAVLRAEGHQTELVALNTTAERRGWSLQLCQRNPEGVCSYALPASLPSEVKTLDVQMKRWLYQVFFEMVRGVTNSFAKQPMPQYEPLVMSYLAWRSHLWWALFMSVGHICACFAWKSCQANVRPTPRMRMCTCRGRRIWRALTYIPPGKICEETPLSEFCKGTVRVQLPREGLATVTGMQLFLVVEVASPRLLMEYEHVNSKRFYLRDVFKSTSL